MGDDAHHVVAGALSMGVDQRPARLLILGATQGVGQALIAELSKPQWAKDLEVHAVSRQVHTAPARHIIPHQHDLDGGPIAVQADGLISLGPIRYALDHLRSRPPNDPMGVAWALSSASTDFKQDSPDDHERELMASILEDEQNLMATCQARGIVYQLYKTTLLYGGGDRNINRVAALIDRLRWVPVIGRGLRSPVHVEDVAQLIITQWDSWRNRHGLMSGTWRLQGGNTLTYPEFLSAIAQGHGLALRRVRLPLGVVRLTLALAHRMGRLTDIKASMLARQRQDLVVDDQSARAQLGWRPRRFSPTRNR